METTNQYSIVIIVISIILFVAILLAALQMLRALKALIKLTHPELETTQGKVKAKKVRQKERWNKIFGLNPLDKEEEIVIDHEYDGIRELDNPVPLWFNALFYSTMVFAAVYLIVYQITGIGMNQEQEYQAAIEEGEKQRLAFLENSGSNIDENTVELDQSAAFVAAGQEIFLANCGMCHGNQGEGIIGPNLTDEYWLHGGEINDVFRTIKYGVPEKGMVSWEANLTPVQIAQVANFILSLEGTNPPNPKAPEGDKKEASQAETTETE